MTGFVALLWALSGLVGGFVAAFYMFEGFVKRGPQDLVRRVLWGIGETYTLRPDKPVAPGERFSCENPECSHRGKPQCPVCGLHFQVTELPDDEPDPEAAPYCCLRMKEEVESSCKVHPVRSECPDTLVAETNGSFGIVIHDGGGSVVDIDYCPWCGASLECASAEEIAASEGAVA